MKYWELYNTFWGAILSVWVGLLLSEYISIPTYYFSIFSISFLSLLFIVLIFLYRSLELGRKSDYVILVLLSFVLSVFMWLLVEKAYTLTGLQKGNNWTLNSALFIAIILFFWVISFLYAKNEWYQ